MAKVTLWPLRTRRNQPVLIQWAASACEVLVDLFWPAGAVFPPAPPPSVGDAAFGSALVPARTGTLCVLSWTACGFAMRIVSKPF
jgi:hypothetical protein